jgi:transketolase
MRQDALNMVYELAKKDKRVIFIGSDLGHGTLKSMKEELPAQFIMEGIAEQYIVGFAAGLAKEGFIPFINTIANFFTRRAFEQIAMDAALHSLPIRFLATGGGMVYAPLGPTHTAIEDLALMWCVPGMKVFCPSDADEMTKLIEMSTESIDSPWYIRFGKGDEPRLNYEFPSKFVKKFGNSKGRILILTTGVLIHEVLKLFEKLTIEQRNRICAAHFMRIDNINFEDIKEEYNNAEFVLVLEEHIPYGGLFSRLLHEFHKNDVPIGKLRHKSLNHIYPHNYGSQKDHFYACGLNFEALLEEIGKELV